MLKITNWMMKNRSSNHKNQVIA